MTDQGPEPLVTDIEAKTLRNQAFRAALWTGANLQVTLMCLQPGEDIGLEVHDDHDQFLRVEEGDGVVQMGPSRDDLAMRRYVRRDEAVLVPAGTWHNITNTGHSPLRLYSIYGPVEHPHGTVHLTKDEALAADAEHGH
jgi:mannose-6-phosphate isomerase-like protein (cupin superfamily)